LNLVQQFKQINKSLSIRFTDKQLFI